MIPSRTSKLRLSPRKFGIADLDPVHRAQALRVVIEAAVRRHQLVERFLAGMAERRMAEVVRQRDRLGKVLVEPQRPRHRAGNLRGLERMSQPRAIVIALVIDEDLGFVFEPAERGGMDYPIAVALKDGAHPMLGFGKPAGRDWPATAIAYGASVRASISSSSCLVRSMLYSWAWMPDYHAGAIAFKSSTHYLWKIATPITPPQASVGPRRATV